MVRKTKEEAEVTRHQILQAARDRFAENGVSGTSLDQIAKAAGVTRGAIYWHFENKSELFFAMRDQVSVPLYDQMDFELRTAPDDPLLAIEKSLRHAIRSLVEDEDTRKTFEIMTMKCEYVGEFASVKQQKLESCQNFQARLTQGYARAQQLGHLTQTVSAELVALDTLSFMTGLYHLWLADQNCTMIREQADALIQAHMQMKRLTQAC